MGSMTLGTSKFQVTPPEKGSFPLDHDGECKTFMLKFMVCLGKNNNENSLCRNEAKDYLQCRMEKNLMAKEDWKSLGYEDLSKSVNKDSDPDVKSSV